MNKQIHVITGSARGKKLKAPKIEEFRAVQAVAKASLFSVLEDKVIDAICLDLFSGSGNLGIEALSRGAKHCTFVDENSNSVEAIEQNLKSCGFDNNSYEVIRKNAVKFTGDTTRNYDIIFLDPFYNDTSHKFLMQNLESTLEEDGVIIFFHGRNLRIEKVLENTNLRVVDQRRFGQSIFTMIMH